MFGRTNIRPVRNGLNALPLGQSDSHTAYQPNALPLGQTDSYTDTSLTPYRWAKGTDLKAKLHVCDEIQTD